jgi:hypothetical protein
MFSYIQNYLQDKESVLRLRTGIQGSSNPNLADPEAIRRIITEWMKDPDFKLLIKSMEKKI